MDVALAILKSMGEGGRRRDKCGVEVYGGVYGCRAGGLADVGDAGGVDGGDDTEEDVFFLCVGEVSGVVLRLKAVL